VSVVRALYAMAALLALTGLGLRVVPVGKPTVATPTTPPPRDGNRSVPLPARSATGEIDSATSHAIISSNIFARSRVALGRALAATVDREHPTPAPRPPTFTLYGTTIGPDGAVALIDAGGSDHRAGLLHIGDLVAGARVVAITDSTATLERPTGLLILHLPPAARQTP
jgi:hypothetical protein